MEVLCYGLTLPLEGDTVKLCVDVYCVGVYVHGQEGRGGVYVMLLYEAHHL